MRRCLLIGLLLLTALTAPARAATWSTPQTVSTTPHTFLGPLATATTGDGTIVAAWPWQQGLGQTAPLGAAASGRPPNGALGPEQPAPTGLLDVGAFAATRTIAIAQTLAAGSGATGAQNQRLVYAYGRADGTFATARTLRTGPILYRPQLSVAPDGRALVAWIEVTKSGSAIRRIVRAVDRAPGGSFGHSYVLSGRSRADVLTVAVGPRGDEALVEVRDGRVMARVRRAGHHWGSFFVLARADGKTQWQLRASIDEHGRVRVVWRRHQFTRPGVPGRLALEDAVMPAGSSRFADSRVIEPDGASEPALVRTAGGWALAYVESTPDGPRPALRTATGAAAFGPVTFAAPGQGGLRGTDTTVLPNGTIVVAWVQPVAGQDSDGQVHAAALAPGDAAFGPVEDASPAEAAHEVRLATDPAAGRAVAIWSARPEGTGPSVPTARIHTVARSATRAP